MHRGYHISARSVASVRLRAQAQGAGSGLGASHMSVSSIISVLSGRSWPGVYSVPLRSARNHMFFPVSQRAAMHGSDDAEGRADAESKRA